MNLHEYEEKVYSQFGNDGVLVEMVRRLEPPRFFMELGCGNGEENNTRILAERLKWTGVWFDCDPTNTARAAQIGEPLGIRTVTTFAQVENAPFLKLHAPTQFGVLSVDIDGNDYYLWDALCSGEYGLRPWVVVIEAQVLRDDWLPPYDANYRWDHASHDCGASVNHMEALGKRLGYTSLGLLSNKHDPNLYFVRDDLVERLG